MQRGGPLSTTLRQKLSSLAGPAAPSVSSNSATFAPTSMGPAKKRGILARWLMSSDEQSQTSLSQSPLLASDEHSSKGKEREWDAGEIDEDMQKIMNAVIFNGGLDFEHILSYLDLYVEADYTVVFLAAGGRYSPGWSWIWKAYRSLSRKYRKNLKKLYIVHSTGFSRMLFSLAGAIISPKFYAKIDYITTLSDLATHIPLSQIKIHPVVYTENLKYEREIVLPVSQQPATSVFGASLDEIMGLDGESGGVPRPVRDAINYLRAYKDDGSTFLEEKGLFRRSPSSALLKQVQAAYDRGQVVDLLQYGDANLAAVLIKKFFRSLPQPIFPDSIFHVIRNCPNPDVEDTRDDAIQYIREKIMGELEGNKQILLNAVMQLLHEVASRSSVNLMDAYNLAIVFTPNLVSNENAIRAVQMSMVLPPPTMRRNSKDIIASKSSSVLPVDTRANEEQGLTLGTVIRFSIDNYYEIFDEMRDVTEAVPGGEFQQLEEGLESSVGSGTSSKPNISSPSTSPGIITPPVQAPITASKSKKIRDGVSSAPPTAWNTAATTTTALPQQNSAQRPQGRIRGPPPSAATQSMALLAKVLSQGAPDSTPSSLQGRDSLQSHLDQTTDRTSKAYQESRDYSGSGQQSQSVAHRSNGPSGSGWTGGRGITGLPRARSVVSIEKTGGSADRKSLGAGRIFSGRESINLGRQTITSGGTVRKAASAGVMGVGITATGFFTPPEVKR
ncbi:hypothetical protein FRC19_003733 [Serendipita sp. 401]|nr:hypothetical protein FRC19_003733 [Serendipita sp. 401]